jgi:hypothetical protein
MTARETNLVNAFETTLAAQLASGGSSIELTSDPGIDAPAYFVIDPDNDSNREVVLWSTGTDHAAAAVTRDIDNKHGGTKPTHASGTTVRLAVVKQHIDDVHDSIQQGFILEDDDGTEVTINPAVASGVYTAREVKFIGTGVDIDWTDVSDGTDGDPYDLTFTLDFNDLSAGTVNQAADSIAILDADDNATKKESIADFVDAINGSGIDVSSGTLVNAAIGKQSMWVPAAAMYPTNTGGCADIALTETTAGRPDMYTLDFDASSDENAQFSIAFPSYWNENTINFQVFWTTTATDTDSVDWELAAVSVVDSGTTDVAFGTAVSVTDNVISAAEDLYVSAVSGNLTVASAAANALTYFNIERDAGSDTMAEDAKLIGIKLFYTVDDVHEA